MADEDVEVNADEGSIDKDEEELEAKQSFFKSKLLLIITGVFLLLLLAGGGYYVFFASTEEEVLEESENIEPTTEVLDETSPEDSTNGITEMQQQNLQMKQHIEALEAMLNQIAPMLQSQKNIPADAEKLPLPYPDNFDYQQGFSESSAMRSPSGSPPPKPSWGEFDRMNIK
ncbi:MAG: hypothetical protein COA83_07385 [Methylophaga sp.]|nr:MAG: hypothetical protein COA83_07385 [Methylophaga sp.]